MKKAEAMDKYLVSYEKGVNSDEICRVVNTVFEIDLDETPLLEHMKGKVFSEVSAAGGRETPETPLSRAVLDSYLAKYEKNITGNEIRQIINDIFGINLDAISALEGARISLFSKGQWIVQHEKDLFVVHTSRKDVEVTIYPTDYFCEKTGSSEMPVDLQHSLTSLGYSYDKRTGSCYFQNSSGEAVSDAFKGQTMGEVLKVIQKDFSNI